MEGETKEGGMDGNKKISIDGGKRGASIKKSKRMKLPTEVEQSILEKPCTDECTHMLTAGDANSDLCLYWFGTWQSLDIQLENPAILQGEYDTAPSELGQSPNSGKRYHTFFQGHLGPVNLSSSADTTDSLVMENRTQCKSC
ncbi:hypothetical protein OIU77_005360 [Salix suchowensis]|uniref:Uncharacterized protein n=1 Tax=Salix suchowensis TaxID=1278906 RepID=A0ABQ9APA2_9ROSI|nr:hypothetical protein OIU77_005360 [Salix suchowensis]